MLRLTRAAPRRLIMERREGRREGKGRRGGERDASAKVMCRRGEKREEKYFGEETKKREIRQVE